MSNPKFTPGTNVSYNPKGAIQIRMAQTTLVGFDSQKPMNWKVKKCEITGEFRPRRITNGKVENRYVIEHFYGWYPAHQKDLNPNLNLNPDKRYFFAYESELRINDVRQTMGK